MKNTLPPEDKFLIGLGFVLGVFISIIVYFINLLLQAKGII